MVPYKQRHHYATGCEESQEGFCRLQEQGLVAGEEKFESCREVDMKLEDILRVGKLKKDIELLEDTILRIRAAVENPKPVTYDKLNIQQTPQNIFELTMIRLEELDEQLDGMKREYVRIQIDFEEAARKVSPMERNLLREYYFDLQGLNVLLCTYNALHEGHEIKERQFYNIIANALEKII